jgi:hypothetical protein
MGHAIEGTREVKIYRVGLALGADSGGYDVKERNKISNSGFGFGEAMLVGVKFDVVRYMFMNDEFK